MPSYDVTVVLWDAVDCPIHNEYYDVKSITQRALEEKGIYCSSGTIIFRTFVGGNPNNYSGFPIYWLQNKGRDARLWKILLILLARANLHGDVGFLNLLVVVGDISQHTEFKRAIGLLNSRRKFNVLLAQPPPQNASSSSKEQLIDKEWLCSRISAGETLMNSLGIGKETFKKKEEEEEAPLTQIPKPLPSPPQVPFAMPKDDGTYKLCLSRQMAKRATTMVFWDTRDFPLPADLHYVNVLLNIKDALSERGYYGPVSITAFLYHDHPCLSGFTGCNTSYLNDGDRDARLWQIALHLLAVARRSRIEPINYMLLMGDISGHIELLRIIYLLNLRFSFNVILAQPPPPPQNASSGQELLGKEWLCSSLSAGDELLSQIEPKLVIQPLTPWQVRFKNANIVVCWDLDEYPIPVGLTAAVASQIIRSAFEKMYYRGTITIHAFGNLLSEPSDANLSHTEDTPSEDTPSDMNLSGIVFHHIPPAQKDLRNEMMLEQLRDWAINNAAPANVMVIVPDISDDMVIAPYLGTLRSIDYNVILAQPQNALGQLFDMDWLCSTLGDRFIPRTRKSASYEFPRLG